MQALSPPPEATKTRISAPPYGNANKTVKSVVTAPLIYWSVDPEDWKYRNAETVRSNIEAGVFDGAIILVHDIYKDQRGRCAGRDRRSAGRGLRVRHGAGPAAAARRNARGGDSLLFGKNNGINLPADAVGEQAFDESRIETHWGYAAMKTCLTTAG